MEFVDIVDLPVLYKECNDLYKKIVEDGVLDAEIISNGITKLHECINRSKQQGMFSKNEDIDEYATNSIKYLFLEYYLGLIYSKSNLPSTRASNLETSLLYLHEFVDRCVSLRIISKSDLGVLDEVIIS